MQPQRAESSHRPCLDPLTCGSLCPFMAVLSLPKPHSLHKPPTPQPTKLDRNRILHSPSKNPFLLSQGKLLPSRTGVLSRKGKGIGGSHARRPQPGSRAKVHAWRIARRVRGKPTGLRDSFASHPQIPSDTSSGFSCHLESLHLRECTLRSSFPPAPAPL